MKNLFNFINECKNFNTEDYVYIYGGKFTKITQQFINSMAKTYPAIYTQTYIKKCKNNIGKIGVDCSGLVCKLAGLNEMNSTMMKNTFEGSTEPFLGAIAWKQGHVAIVVNVNGSTIKVLEAKGIDYGVLFSNYDKSYFTKYLKAPTVNYEQKQYRIDFSEEFLRKFCEALEKAIIISEK